MNTIVEFYFDFGSPTAYLAHKRLQQLQERYRFDLVYKPILLGGLFKATGNTNFYFDSGSIKARIITPLKLVIGTIGN